jgi:hypothetical protein
LLSWNGTLSRELRSPVLSLLDAGGHCLIIIFKLHSAGLGELIGEPALVVAFIRQDGNGCPAAGDIALVPIPVSAKAVAADEPIEEASCLAFALALVRAGLLPA